MNVKKFFIIFITISIIFSCSYQENRKEAIKVIEKYFNILIINDIDEILKLYSKDFFSITSYEEWKNTLKIVYKKLGKLKSFKLKLAKIVNNISKNGIRYDATLIFEVDYENYSSTKF